MMSRNAFAFACLAVPALVELGLGIVYLTATGLMPYHEQALGTDWSGLEPGVRMLLLTFLRGYGSTHLAVGIALVALLAIPLRQGQAWARWASLAIGLPALAATACLSTQLALTTGAGVPWQGAVALLALFLLGIALVDPAARARR